MNDFTENLTLTPFVERCLESRTYMLGAFADWHRVTRRKWCSYPDYHLPNSIAACQHHAHAVFTLLNKLYDLAIASYAWITRAHYEQQKQLQAKVSRLAVQLAIACIRLHRAMRRHGQFIHNRAETGFPSEVTALYCDVDASLADTMRACCATVSALHRALPATLSASTIRTCVRFADDTAIFEEVH